MNNPSRLVTAALFVAALAACSSNPDTTKPNTAMPDDIPSVIESTDEAPTSTPGEATLEALNTWFGAKFVVQDQNERERGTGIATDSAGNVVASVASTGEYGANFGPLAHPTNTVVVKLDSSGARVWSRTMGVANQSRLSGSDHSERATYPAGVATDTENSVYVAGFVAGSLNGQTNSGRQDAFLIKLSSSGNVLWTRLLGAVGDDGVTGIATNGTNIYLTGYACGNGMRFAGNTIQGPCDVFVSKYDKNGNRLWAKLFGSSRNDYAAKIAKVSSGGAVVVGTYESTTFNANGFPINRDGFVIRLDPNGNVIWNKTISSPQNDEALAVVASDSVVYVGGKTEGSLNGTPRTRTGSTDLTDAFVLQMSTSNGNTQWTRFIPGTEGDPTFGFAFVNELGLDATGNVFAMGDGFERRTENTDIKWPVRFNASGAQTATSSFVYSTPDGNVSSTKKNIAVGSAGIFVLLDDYLWKTPAQGSFIAKSDEVFIARLSGDLVLQ